MSTDLSNISPALEASALSIGYRCGRKEGWKTVHPRVNFVLHRGELTSLIGLNGAGKSADRTERGGQVDAAADPVRIPAGCKRDRAGTRAGTVGVFFP